MSKKRCAGCGNEVDEVCADGYCRACHKSVTWEDCITKTFEARNLLELGLPMEEVKRFYPDARVGGLA